MACCCSSLPTSFFIGAEAEVVLVVMVAVVVVVMLLVVVVLTEVGAEPGTAGSDFRDWRGDTGGTDCCCNVEAEGGCKPALPGG